MTFSNGLLELHDFSEIEPGYGQVLGLFNAIFSFIAAIIGVIVLFSVLNTMSMSVMERTSEIGTARAIGALRRDIRLQFVLEGGLIGFIGASFGILLAIGLAQLVNRVGITWTPPGQAEPVPLRV